MSEKQFEEDLMYLLEQIGYLDEEDSSDFFLDVPETFRDATDHRSFHDAGVLTNNKGVVFRDRNGEEYYITIHKK